MVREIDLDRELTCHTCDETHTNFHKEIYNHAAGAQPLIVCNECGCGHDEWTY